jgi:hypothetical protein
MLNIHITIITLFSMLGTGSTDFYIRSQECILFSKHPSHYNYSLHIYFITITPNQLKITYFILMAFRPRLNIYIKHKFFIVFFL